MIWNYLAAVGITLGLSYFLAGCVGFIVYGEYENATIEQVQNIRSLVWLLWFFLMSISHFIIQVVLR